MSRNSTQTTLFYVHDPMCSWCWGFSSILSALRQQLPAKTGFRRLLGGLAPDTSEPMPAAMQQMLQDTWHRIEDKIPDVQFNFDFWEKCAPRRSTYPACRAVIAARMQGNEYDELMTAAIQRAYYQEARNPSDEDTLVAVAGELGLDEKRFTTDLLADDTQQILLDEIQQTRALNVDSFPALVLKIGTSIWRVPVDYTDATSMLEMIALISEDN